MVAVMFQVAAVPEGLADVPPGPELAAALAEIDLTTVPNDRMIEVVQAEHRQLAHHQGRLFAALAEVGRCAAASEPGEVARAEAPVIESIHEIGPALHWTSNAAFAEHDLAETLRTRLPAVQAALLAGEIDRAKARAFVEYTRELTDEQIALVCAELLPVAPRLTTGQLIDRLRRMVIALDPEAFDRRYRRALRERRVWGYLGADGTATLGASGLTPEEGAASAERVWALARTIRAGGHPDPLAQVRADLFVALLDGSLVGLSNAQIVQAMLGRRGGGSPERPRRPRAQDGSVRRVDGGSGSAEAVDLDVDRSTEVPAGSSVVPAFGMRTGVEVRIRLTTLLALDDQPADIPGWGPTPARSARATVGRQLAARWRFAITDRDGYLLLAGTTRRRPRLPSLEEPDAGGDPPSYLVRNHGGVVEVQVPLDVLIGLAAEPPPGSEALIADLVEQWARRDELRADLESAADARFPHAALRRHVEVRDRTCVFPGCRRPAMACQQDHTEEVRRGGRTRADNLGPLCVRHHSLKSRGGWRLRQPRPGWFRWTGPSRRRYATRGEPILPALPDPMPAPRDADDGRRPAAPELDQPPDFRRAPPRERPPPGRAWRLHDARRHHRRPAVGGAEGAGQDDDPPF
jgi:hypothetical protein